MLRCRRWVALVLGLTSLFLVSIVPLRARSLECTPKFVAARDIPAAARETLAQVRRTGQPLPNYVGGRRFGNYGRGGERKLPVLDTLGRPITYREWDIHPKVPGRNRGPERLVTGSDGRAWYTADHYCSFTEVK